MAAIIYDFKAIGGALRKQRIDDWWQPAKPEPKAVEPITSDAEAWSRPVRPQSSRIRGSATVRVGSIISCDMSPRSDCKQPSSPECAR